MVSVLGALFPNSGRLGHSAGGDGLAGSGTQGNPTPVCMVKAMALSRRLFLLIPIAGAFVVAAVAVVVFVMNREGQDAEDENPASKTVFVFAEFGTTADGIYRASADNPSERSLIATVEHAPEWGINPAVRPSGFRIAFTVLPPGSTPARETAAELWLLDAETGKQRLLASDADLLTAPVFDRAGEHLAYRSDGEANRQSLVSVDLATGERHTLHTVETQFGIYPVGFASDGALLFANLSRSGTDLFRLADGGQPELILHASDQIARDWGVSPDGKAISFVAPETREQRVVNRLRVVDLLGKKRVSIPAAETPSTADQFSPIWRPDGTAITVGREAYPNRNASAVTYPLDGNTAQALATPEQGYDVPLSWSADGEYLAARSFEGTTANEPGKESLVVIAPDGQRRAVTALNEVLFLGWMMSSG